ncbi:MAG: YkuS family protein [Candidatus Contubernalis sp.]|nr:YkuS family protein [Candidatus Contubernalis sp.]
MFKVAVSPYLHSVKEKLHKEGIEVVELDSEDIHHLSNDISAVIISGGDENMMGMQDIQGEIPVINAQGKTAEEIATQVKNKLTLQK